MEEVTYMRRYALRDDQWEQIRHHLPGQEGFRGPNAQDNRLFVEAVIYRYRAGIPWRDLPEKFGNWKNIIGDGVDGPRREFGRESFSIYPKMLTMNIL